jgi:RNA-dependent RNA polymerase
MRSISFSANEGDLSDSFAEIFHAEPFLSLSPEVLINPVVTLFRDKIHKGAKRHSGSGLLTLPSPEIGRLFLDLYGERSSNRLLIRGRNLLVKESNPPLRHDLIDLSRNTPYTPYSQILAREQEKEKMGQKMPTQFLEFGRECRDGAFSVEWCRAFRSDGSIRFDPDKRQIQIAIPEQSHAVGGYSSTTDTLRQLFELEVTEGPALIIAFRFADIQGISLNHDRAAPTIFFTLNTAASFYRRGGQKPVVDLFGGLDDQVHMLTPASHLDELHRIVAPFTSTALRVALGSPDASKDFRRLAKRMHLRMIDHSPRIVRRDLYNKGLLVDLEGWFSTLPLHVAFQCDALMRGPTCLVDAVEMQSLKEPIDILLREHGQAKTASFLKHFGNRLSQLWFGQEENTTIHTVSGVFKSLKSKYDFRGKWEERRQESKAL